MVQKTFISIIRHYQIKNHTIFNKKSIEISSSNNGHWIPYPDGEMLKRVLWISLANSNLSETLSNGNFTDFPSTCKQIKFCSKDTASIWCVAAIVGH